MRPIGLVLISTACAATVTFNEAVSRLPVTRPEPPVTISDTIIALAIREAALRGIPAFPTQRHIVVQRLADVVSSRSLPWIDSVSFLVLDSAQLIRVAAHAGHFAYLRPYPPRIDGDTAVVSVASRFAADPTVARALYGGACSWRAVRQSGSWVLDTVVGCGIW